MDHLQVDVDGEKIRLIYDSEGDVLDVLFSEPEPATGIQLTAHILLQLNRNTGRLLSLTIVDFSVLSERTEFGLRSFPMNNLGDLPEDLRDATIRALKSPILSHFLHISNFHAAPATYVPAIALEPQALPAAA